MKLFLTLKKKYAHVCSNLFRPQTKTVCCCSMGKAWGLNCESCPSHGGSDYKAMCGSGPPGVMVNPMTNQTEEIDECQLMPGMISIIPLISRRIL